MTYNTLSTILFCAALSGCGGFLVQPPAAVAVGEIATQAPGHGDVANAARQAPAAKSELMLQVLTSLGIDYRNGGRSPESGFDCSGFVAYVYEQAFGIRLPRNSQKQSEFGSRIQRAELEPGDLVFYDTLKRPNSHVGIYLGDGRFVHAPKSGAKVRVESMESRYWTERFNGARRIGTSL